jgi:glycosyltransferase involved in cell wall biosynthesis
LVFGQLTGNNSENDRKNLLHTIRTLCEAFASSPDVGVFLKTNSGKSTKIDKFITRTTLTNVLTQVRKGPYPRFYFLHGSFDDREIASLYRHPKVTALVSLTRGEGFGLPILEAAASDLPVIATDWSGYLDFMNLGKFIKVNRDIKEIHPSRVDSNIFMKDARWAFPDEQDFKEKVLKFYKKNEKPRAWAQELGETIREQYSFQSIASMYDLKFGKILEG